MKRAVFVIREFVIVTYVRTAVFSDVRRYFTFLRSFQHMLGKFVGVINARIQTAV